MGHLIQFKNTRLVSMKEFKWSIGHISTVTAADIIHVVTIKMANAFDFPHMRQSQPPPHSSADDFPPRGTAESQGNSSGAPRTQPELLSPGTAGASTGATSCPPASLADFPPRGTAESQGNPSGVPRASRAPSYADVSRRGQNDRGNAPYRGRYRSQNRNRMLPAGLNNPAMVPVNVSNAEWVEFVVALLLSRESVVLFMLVSTLSNSVSTKSVVITFDELFERLLGKVSTFTVLSVLARVVGYTTVDAVDGTRFDASIDLARAAVAGFPMFKLLFTEADSNSFIGDKKSVPATDTSEFIGDMQPVEPLALLQMQLMADYLMMLKSLQLQSGSPYPLLPSSHQV
uniref:Uncharacterized protein n=1 Tax=Lutzomyia longipalpis TaxID=7200 RepID=A0A1B0CUT9_LUTLO